MKSTDNVSFFIGVDEHNFGGRRKDLRGRGAAGKIAVLGLLKRAGKVYTAIIPNAKTPDLTSNY
jgi:transposase